MSTPKLKPWQAFTTVFILWPIATVVCIWSWTILWNWWVEPILHFHMTYAFSAGFGAFYGYYAKRSTKEETERSASEWGATWFWAIMFRPTLVGIGWLIRHFWMGL